MNNINNNMSQKEMNRRLKDDLRAIKRQRKANRKFYQKKRFIIPAIIVALALFNMGDAEVEEATKKGYTDATKTTTVAKVVKAPEVVKVAEKAPEVVKVAPVVPKIPTEYKSALRSAESYGDIMNMSKKGIYDQLISEYGDKFSKASAQYAVDNAKIDYKANALKKGQTYQDTMSMSPQAVYDQLISQYGEKFTKAEAQYAKDNLK